MERLAGLDPMFVYSDTPEFPLEVAYACVLDPATAPTGYAFERVVRMFELKVPSIPQLRRRLVPVPLGLDHPRWVDDPAFDLGDHLHRVALPGPGGEGEFAAAVGDVLGHSLTPGQAPWEIHVVEGLADGRVGLIAKMHHAAIDGVTGADLLAQLLDLAPRDPLEQPPAPPGAPARLPSAARLVADALPNLAASPVRAVRAAREVGRTGARLVRRAVECGVDAVSIPLGAPSTFEAPARGRRAVAFARLDLPAVRSLKARFGATVNDVVLAVSSGALRRYLALLGTDASRPLVAVVPVSLRGAVPIAGNQLSAMFVQLANDRRAPLERLLAVMEVSDMCKGQERAVGYGPMASTVVDAVPPALARPVVRLGVRAGMLRKVRAGNLLISNVPGPDVPLYFAGMELRALHPLGPVVDGMPLNVTVQRYCDELFVGINACARTVPELPALARAMGDELVQLCAETEQPGARAGTAAARRARVERAAVRARR